ncbi:hypothetical protein AALP_AA4G260900 [Arabis alpina]|uniref:ZNF598/HEL2 PAH domain-containing protein n=1 Tax=Arabis alpina TaxID=50452 RepID=A0A087H5R7_ARAAL|nr:hypothetical protein AALP_AA4G260900 [Arabis alpina]
MVEKCWICEEDLEWVAYGSCDHRGVCCTCVVRNRFLRDDLRCYQCTQRSSIVYVTQPLNEDQYWYHEDSQALFTDFDEYTRIKEMCRLVCSACNETNFECIGQLMTHLYEKHRLYMCIACLVYGSQFVSEHKLFTKAQLNQHIRTGDSEADGNVIERAGFTGHPKCELCRNPFYGDEEVFVHISSVSNSCCHICDEWLRPGIPTNDVEDHFRFYHIDPEDGYWLAPFSIIRAFEDQAHLDWHNDTEHSTTEVPLHVRYGRNSWFAPDGESTSGDQSESGQYSGSLVSNSVAAPLGNQTDRSVIATCSSGADQGLTQSSISNRGISSAYAESSHHASGATTGTRASSLNTQSSPGAREEPSRSVSLQASVAQHFNLPSSSRNEIKAFNEKIRDHLFNTMKDVSRKYRQGLISAENYLEYLKYQGLSDLVLELASFCPDPTRREELIETYTASLREEGRGE